MKMIYIASPYTIGDQAENVRKQLDAANELMDMGFCPIAPLLSHFQHIMHPRPYEDWLRIDEEKLRCCDAILRLPGESKGADREEALAIKLGIPVFYNINGVGLFFTSKFIHE